MSFIYTELLFRPLFNLLVFIFNIIPGGDLGVAILLLTILIRLALSPLSVKALRSQREMTKLQPQLQELQKKHKGDKEKLGQETMKLYKENNANPFGGCLPLLIQFPIIIALYRVFIKGLLPETLDQLYSFVPNPGVMSPIAFGFLDLAVASGFLAVLVGVLQAINARNTLRHQKQDNPNAQQNQALKMSRQMLYFLPVMMVVISWRLPSGLVLYFAMTTIFSIFEGLYIRRKYPVEQPMKQIEQAKP
ncbi:MAG: YidC/Oxa1 family membrane protein insertase [Parcubacteria group bacterium]